MQSAFACWEVAWEQAEVTKKQTRDDIKSRVIGIFVSEKFLNRLVQRAGFSNNVQFASGALFLPAVEKEDRDLRTSSANS